MVRLCLFMVSGPVRYVQASLEAAKLLGAVIRLNMCKTAHKCLLHYAVVLCCGLGPIGLLNWLIAMPGNPEYTAHCWHPTAPHPTTPLTHPLLIILYTQLMIFLKLEKDLTCKSNWLLLNVFVHWKLMNSCIFSATLGWLQLITEKVGWIE